MVTLITGKIADQTEIKTVEALLAEGENTVFKGALNNGWVGGPCYSPYLQDALNEGPKTEV